jgi:hypothetical protein
MSRPWKHPKTGIYWLRKRVPDDLQKLVGKREEKQSLGTRDPAEAKRKHLATLTAVEERWANLRAGPRTLTEREAHELAQPQYDEWLALHRDFPSQQPWSIEIGAMAFNPNAVVGDLWWEVREHRIRCIERASSRLAELGTMVDEKGQRAFASAIADAYGRASLKLQEWARGNFGTETSAHVSTPTGRAAGGAAPPVASAPISFEELIKIWAAEQKPSPRTLYNWTGAVKRLKASVGHDDAARLTPNDMARWKASLIDAGLNPAAL